MLRGAWAPFRPAPFRLSRLLGLRGSGQGMNSRKKGPPPGDSPATSQAGTCAQATEERWPGYCRAGSQGAATRQAASVVTGAAATDLDPR